MEMSIGLPSLAAVSLASSSSMTFSRYLIWARSTPSWCLARLVLSASSSSPRLTVIGLSIGSPLGLVGVVSTSSPMRVGSPQLDELLVLLRPNQRRDQVREPGQELARLPLIGSWQGAVVHDEAVARLELADDAQTAAPVLDEGSLHLVLLCDMRKAPPVGGARSLRPRQERGWSTSPGCRRRLVPPGRRSRRCCRRATPSAGTA